MKITEKNYKIAKQLYLQAGVNPDTIIKKLTQIPISLHCWQGDDVSGFENPDSTLDSGLMATGSYPGKAKTPQQLRDDLQKAFSLIPTKCRLNLHSIYAETGTKKIERNQLQVKHFENWLGWAKENKIALDFNPSCFAHPLAASGFTLASLDKNIRKFWIEHVIACRKIGEYFGKTLGKTCITNIWIPDGYKDIPANRKIHRELLKNSLDEIFKIKINKKHNLDSVESKLFGIGSESYVVGSHEFYMGYAAKNNLLLCLDTGHFHPTETVSDKISSIMLFFNHLLLHISRGIRWDSDHIVILSDELIAIAQEIIRGGFEKQVHIGLDFFDASINRIAAWVIGARSMLKALLYALLEPTAQLQKLEKNGDFTARIALMEKTKTMPIGAVWDYFCMINNVPSENDWLKEVKNYEKNVLIKR